MFSRGTQSYSAFYRFQMGRLGQRPRARGCQKSSAASLDPLGTRGGGRDTYFLELGAKMPGPSISDGLPCAFQTKFPEGKARQMEGKQKGGSKRHQTMRS